MTFPIMYAGFDGLDVAFQGKIPAYALDTLETARTEAQEARADALAYIGPGKLAAHVGETGARGGYRYRMDTGPEGVIWFIKRGDDPQDWNLRASVKSATLAVHGYQGVQDLLYRDLEAMGATVLSESIGRVDFAVDFLIKDFDLRPENFVCGSQMRRSEYYVTELDRDKMAAHAPTLHNEDDQHRLVNRTGPRVTGVTLGKMPNRQVIVYDKRREVIDRRLTKSFWWDVWGLDRNDKDNQVWRVELRMGKTYLKERYNLVTWEDFEASICDLFKSCVQEIRYVQSGTDSNRARWANDPLWDQVAGQVDECLSQWESGLLPGRVKAQTRENFIKCYEGLIAGMSASYAAAIGLKWNENGKVTERMAGVVNDLVLNRPGEFIAKKERARQRMYFINERSAADDAYQDERGSVGLGGRFEAGNVGRWQGEGVAGGGGSSLADPRSI